MGDTRKPNGTEQTTYRMADGSLIGDEYTTVTNLEWFDDGYWAPVELIEEVWVLKSSRALTYIAPHVYKDCPNLGEGHDEQCPLCEGDDMVECVPGITYKDDES